MDILIEELEGSLWVAALQNGRLEGMEVDSPYEAVRWGSLYWAKVTSVDAALDAVFLDLDGENSGMLYNKDVRYRDKDGVMRKGGEEAIGKRFQPGDMIAVQAKSAYLPKEKDIYIHRENKLPQMSMDVTLPGRYLVYSPTMNENRISTRIRDKALRKKMLKMLDQLADIQGCILRSAAADMQTDMLVREGKILRETWDRLQEFLGGSVPELIMLGPDAIQRTLSDQASRQIERVEVVTMDHYNQAEEWCDIFAPDLVTKIQPVELKNASEDLALFHYRDIIGQIEDLYQPYGFLPGGGNIIVQDTAALTAVDVNKGADKGSNLSVNIEAAREVARQMRLRNLGGIVVVDFLKIQSKKDEGQLIAELEKAINFDPCTVQIHGKTALGLFEITRKRRTPPLHERYEGIVG